MRILPVLCLAALLLAPGAASAGLINGGFEEGSFDGWTQSGDLSSSLVVAPGHSGTYAAYFGPVNGLGFISQTITTSPSASYVVDFWLAHDGGNPNEFRFVWNNNLVVSMVNAGEFGWTHYAYNVTASAASTTVSFGFYNPPEFWGFDDAAVTSTPEPATIWLAAAALLALGALRRRAA
jgi:MYXO-CTERM domain-containing protein